MFSEEDVSKIVDLRLRGNVIVLQKIIVHLGGSMIIRFSYHAQTMHYPTKMDFFKPSRFLAHCACI